ncbi:MAG: regulatory signaling modulator protein AmpE [Gammaproteobacteria bacterium]|nr:regulatory signaling modulator protein AmpE [Gammaproteobacteria bacterium]
MTFIVAFVGLVVERFFDWSHLRRWGWFFSYQHSLVKRIPYASSYILLAINIIPLLMIVVLIDFILKSFLYGILSLSFQLIFFLYCLGPHNLWADTFACITALTKNEEASAQEKLESTFHLTISEKNVSLQKDFLGHLFVAANERVFGVLFWYVVLGPLGPLLYRTISLSTAKEQRPDPKLMKTAGQILSILDWIPARLFAFLFALSGHFVEVCQTYRRYFSLSPRNNHILLRETGLAGISATDAIAKNDATIENQAINLIDRTLVVALILVALFTLLYP